MASKARHKRLYSPHLPDQSVTDDFHMLESQRSTPRKRQRSEQAIPQQNGKLLPSPKRQKSSHPPFGSHAPPAFWDNLSKVWLTTGALRELDRRNTLIRSSLNPPSSPYQRPPRQLTRRAITEVKQSCRPLFAPDLLYRCTAETLKDIRQFARHGGPDLLDIRGCPEPIDPRRDRMSPSQSNSRRRKRSSGSPKPATKTTNTSKTTSVYSRNFLQNLVDHGVYPEEYDYPDDRSAPPPDNLEKINERLLQPRPSLSPSRFLDEAFRKFKRADAHVSKEKKATDAVIPIIEGEVKNARCHEGNVPFNNLDPLTDGTLAAASPDRYYGARPEQLNRSIRNELSRQIVPSTQEDLPMAPNFFLEAKGPDGTIAVARRQAAYDGALGARGMQNLQSYGEHEPVYDDNAYTITSIYSGGTLSLYTTHPGLPAGPGNPPEYYMNQLNSFAMTGNIASFRQGAAAYRNTRDWAKEKRDEFIEAANGKLPKRPTES